VATQALDLNVSRRKLSLVVGVLATAVVVFFIYQADFAAVLDTWLGALVAWVATWGGIMLVHYYVIERGEMQVDRLFDPPGTRRLPNVNWAGYVAFFTGIAATWLFMFGVTPTFQGPVAVAMGGVDLSWLAGAGVAAAVYAVLGPVVARKYAGLATATVPAPRVTEPVVADLPETPGVIA
jgi:purine-cytosine permease-like protein